MTINKKIIIELESIHRRFFSDDLKRYLLVKYAQEPLPHEFSEQDIYTNIENDICAYEAGDLDVTLTGPSERWQEERDYLQSLYIEKYREVRDLEAYVDELELILLKHGLKSSRMAGERIKF